MPGLYFTLHPVASAASQTKFLSLINIAIELIYLFVDFR